MKFSQFSSYLQKLENTSSRLALIEILSELFKKAKSADELEKIVYLIQGRIAPFFESLEIGMAEKTVAQSIANAYKKNREEVLKLYEKEGDMGKAVEKLCVNNKQNSTLTVDEVFNTLTQIAK